jgi:hypothetical protein
MQKPVEFPIKKKIDDTKVPEAPVDKKVENIADKAAHKAAKTVQDYDKQHTIISK